jgi:MoxR-like ATPase
VASVARASVSIIAQATHRPAHVIDRTSQLAINAVLAAGRPLLVRGEPGVGKSQLALAAARALDRIPLHATTSRMPGCRPFGLQHTAAAAR